MGAMTIAMFWSGSAIDLTLERPDGSIIDSASAGSDPNISFFSGDTYLSYTIQAPHIGAWKLHVSGTLGQAYKATISAVDAMHLSAEIDKQEYFINDPIQFNLY